MLGSWKPQSGSRGYAFHLGTVLGFMYTYIYIHISVSSVKKSRVISVEVGLARVPCAQWPARTQTLLHTLDTQSLLHTLCRALSSGDKRLRILMVLGGLSRQARTCYIPLVTGYVACVGPGLVTSLWF